MFLKLYALALPIFFAIDLLWLGLVAKNFYATQIGFLMKEKVNWPAALLFYLLFVVGIVFFIVQPNLEKGVWWQVLLAGMLFGLITYATYDLTNLATVKNWPLVVTLIDLLWGSALAGGVSLITFVIAKKLGL